MRDTARWIVGLPKASSTYEPPPLSGIEQLFANNPSSAPKLAGNRDDLRGDIANAVKQSERSSEKAPVSKPEVSSEASPMHARDRRLFLHLGIPAALAISAFSVGLGSFVSGSPHWGFGLCAPSFLVLIAMAVYLFEMQPTPFKPPYPFAGLVLIATLTWAFVAWQTWLWLHSPAIYTQAQMDRAVEAARAKQPAPMIGFTQEQVDQKIAAAVAQDKAEISQLRTALDRQRNTPINENTPQSQSPSNQAPPNQRVFTDKSVEDLWASFCEGRTEMQCDLFMADEKGKWINATGKVGSVQAPSSVLLLVGTSNRAVGCFFDDKWTAKLGTFRRNDVMKVAGKIAHFQTGTLMLRECELRD